MSDPAAPGQQLNSIPHDADNPATVHSFLPDAPPHAKAAAAGQAKAHPKNAMHSNDEGGKEVKADTSRGAPIPPTITISDADKAKADELGNGDAVTSQRMAANREVVPGAIPDALAASIPDWYQVGWRVVGGIDKKASMSPEESDRSLLAAFIREQYYGEWFHDAGIILFAVLISHFLTLFRAGWGSFIILLAVCCTYYTTSLGRVRRRARDDIQRELVKTRLLSEHESAEWINHFLDRFWLIYEPVLSATIVSSVDQILSTNTPPFLESIRLTTFTLGTKAPRIDKVRTFPNTAEDTVMMDWGLSFTPNDVSNLTTDQAASKVNPKIVLSVRLGKGFASAAMPILLEDITFTGTIRIRLKLMTNFPHVGAVDITFMEQPFIDYVLKPIGGDTFGFDIANIPGLSSFIRDMTHSTLGPMMYDPHVFTLNLEQLLSGTPLDAAIGVLQVTIHTARGLKGTKIGGGTPDPYVSLSINQRAELARTKHKPHTYNPTWHETKFLLVNSLAEVLTMNVMDFNEHRKDSLLGSGLFELAKLQQDAVLENLDAPVLKDGKERGELHFDLSFYPVLKATKDEPIPETSVGIVRLTIHQAKDLDHTKSLSGDLNPFAKVILGSSHTVIHNTPRVKHTNNPVWESSTEFLCLDRASSVIAIQVVDDRDFLFDPVVGYMSVKLDDLLEAKKQDARDWWPLDGCKSGRLRLSVEWKPLNMAGSLQGADRYVPPIGIIRLWIQKATDVKNVEATLGGKSDPYVRVLAQNITMARTEVMNNNLNPEWDQIVYVPVHSLKEDLYLECMDYQHITRDRSLGWVQLAMGDLGTESPTDKDYPYASLGKKEYVERIRLEKGMYKGFLHFAAEFVPALLLRGISFDSPSNEIRRTAGERSSSTSMSSSRVENTPRVTVTENDVAAENEQSKPGHPQSVKSLDTTPSEDTHDTGAAEHTSGATTPPEKQKYEGAELSTEELLKRQSGIIVFNLIEGHLAKKSRLEVLLDEGYWPSVVTPKSRSHQAMFDQVGEGFVKELDFSQVWLRLNENDDSEREHIIAEVKVDAKSFLAHTLEGPFEFTLRDQDDKNESTIKISTKYIPVNINLEPRESINNQGFLHVELVEGRDILAADRSGKSDPFAVFTLNGQKMFRSQVKKKTLTPEWNESFDINVPSRVGSRFEVEVFDWNQIEQAKSLGVGSIELESVEPFQGTTRAVLLSTAKHGVKGEIRINLHFQPAIIVKTRKATTTFSTAGRAMTQVGGIPIGAGKGIVHGVGSAGRTVRSVLKRDHGSKTSLETPQDDHVLAEGIPTAQVSRPTGVAAAVLPTTSHVPDSQTPIEYGILKVSVLRAADLPGISSGDALRPYVVLKVGEKEQRTKHTGKTTTPEWDDCYRFPAGLDTKSLSVTIYDHKTIGKDRLLGEADVDIWSHIKPYAPAADVGVELREGQGLLHLRLEFERNKPSNGSVSSLGDPTPSPSKLTSLRKSLTRDRL